MMPPPGGVRHDFRGVVETELLHQVRAVRLDRVRAEVKNGRHFRMVARS
jgi:hypothetical protein